MKPPFIFHIDTLGICNLRCPSCPTGRRELALTKSVISPETLKKICKKAQREANVMAMGLASWTEPTLHPKLPELIRVVKSFKFPCWLSSNLNYEANWESIMRENPTAFTISVSGFTPQVYEIGHRGGDIRKVKANAEKLVEWKHKTNATTNIRMSWHRYVHNEHEMHLMEEWCGNLGISFVPGYAKLLPLEEAINCFEGKRLEHPDTQRIAKNFLFTPHKAAMTSLKFKDVPCRFLQRELVMDSEANVTVCCSLGDPKPYIVGNYLTDSLEEIQMRKNSHPICTRCMAVGGHAYMMGVYRARDYWYQKAAYVWCNTLGRVVKNVFSILPKWRRI